MSSTPVLNPQDVARWCAVLAEGEAPRDLSGAADAEVVDLIAGLELLKNAAAAVQADLAVTLDASVRSQDAAADVPAAQRGRGVASQVALARQESPYRGQVLLGFAKDLATDLPHTRAALRGGILNEYRALLVARESAVLDSAARAEVDERVCADGDHLRGLGTGQLVGELRRHCYALDPVSITRRAARAESERRVSLRPAPDTMTYLTALLPVGAGVAAYAALVRDAEGARASGDERGKGQLMADLLVERVTGQADASAVPVGVEVVMSDATLFGAGHEPAYVGGAGGSTQVVPAQIARELVGSALDAGTQSWIRRFYADASGDLVAMTSRQRFVRGGLAGYLRVRDQGTCRTPWCDAPARDGDHVVAVADGGPTDAPNLQGLCEACDHAKQARGWRQRPRPGPGRHVVETVTPTGHVYSSRAPRPPDPAIPARTALDRALDRILASTW